MHTFFDVANMALDQFSEGKAKTPGHWANDGNFKTCFITRETHAWWILELGANVRVSMVFVLHYRHMTFLGFGIYVGKCVLSKPPYSLIRCYHRSVLCI